MEHESLEARARYLYAPARLEERFRTFESIMLPSMEAQTDPDFTLLIVTGPSLPAASKSRLRDLVAHLPNVTICEAPPGPHRKTMQAAINAVRDESREPCLQFRMDDDDAVGVRFVERLRETARDVLNLLDTNRHVAIDFTRGYIVRPGPKGLDVARSATPLTTAGLALMVRPDLPLSVMNFAHNKLGLFMPVLSMPDADMTVRGHNDFNDSRQKTGLRKVAFSPLDTEGEALFRSAFNIDTDRVRAVYAGAAS